MSPVERSITRYGEPEALQDLLGVSHHPLQLGHRGLGRRELDQLHLVELMLPEEALDVLAVRARPRTGNRA